MKGFTATLVVTLLIIYAVAFANPKWISYHGVLTDKNELPISGTVSMTFRICDIQTGGAPLWSEVQQVQISNGIFNVRLGEISPFPSSLFENDALYIGVQVGIDSEMEPRQPLTSEGFVFDAKR